MKPLFLNCIGVTGSFASGKSTVAKTLAEMIGGCFFDADKEVAYLLKKNAKGWFAIRALLGADFFDQSGNVDKPKLRQAIFTDNLLRKKVESVLHPLVRKRLKFKLDEALLLDGKQAVIEVPLLFEADWQDDFSLVVVVSVTEANAIKRAIARDGVTAGQARKVISAQFPLKEKVLLADHVIDNNKSLMDTMQQLVELKKNLDTGNLTA